MTSNRLTPTTLPEPSWREWILWLLRRRSRIRVTGNSMRPTLLPGDIVLVDPRAYSSNAPAVNDIVIAHHPYQKELIIIKRVAGLTPEGRLVLLSDNPQAGSDSRQLGPISMQRVIGQVTSRSPAMP